MAWKVQKEPKVLHTLFLIHDNTKFAKHAFYCVIL